MVKRNKNTGMLETTLDKIAASYDEMRAAYDVICEIHADLSDEQQLGPVVAEAAATIYQLGEIVKAFDDLDDKLRDFLFRAGRSV